MRGSMVNALLLAVAGIVGGIRAGDGITGPVSGLLWDASGRQIRPILGWPGAAHLGEAVLSAFSGGLVILASGPGNALLVSNDTPFELILASDLRTGHPRTVALPGAMESAVELAADLKKSTAVLLSRASREVQFLTGIPDSPVAGPRIPLPDDLTDVVSLDVSERGEMALVASDHDLFLVRADGGWQRIASDFGQISAALLLNQGQDAAVADRGSHRIELIRDISNTAVRSVAARAIDGIDEPAALAITRSGQLLAVEARAAVMVVMDLGSQNPAHQVTLPSPARRCERLDDGDLFLLSGPGDNPLYVLQTDGEFATYFVPLR